VCVCCLSSVRVVRGQYRRRQRSASHREGLKPAGARRAAARCAARKPVPGRRRLVDLGPISGASQASHRMLYRRSHHQYLYKPGARAFVRTGSVCLFFGWRSGRSVAIMHRQRWRDGAPAGRTGVCVFFDRLPAQRGCKRRRSALRAPD
jgi:hypothetical protein